MTEISTEAAMLSIKWFRLRRKLSSKHKLFLEIMTFAYIGTNAKNSGIDIKKTTRESLDSKGKTRKDMVYQMVVEVEEE